ncbi:MAG TPA: TadE family protein [Candidatus Limnocylindrales bacterium]|jgi:hypothetical protein
MRWPRRTHPKSRGQALAEFAIVFPIAFIVIMGIVVFGLFVFYQQQLTNVAREAARFAAIHSATALCPTVGWRDPQAPPLTYPAPIHCDGPDNASDPYPWPNMTDHARAYAWGLDPATIWLNACWSGYAPAGTVIGSPPDYSDASGFPRADQPPVDALGTPNVFAPCTINRIDPVNNAGALGCAMAMTTPADDPSSSIPGNQVTVYACFDWSPPLGGLLFVPSTVTMRAVITEVIQRQQ